jgi:hypothetical protein
MGLTGFDMTPLFFQQNKKQKTQIQTIQKQLLTLELKEYL